MSTQHGIALVLHIGQQVRHRDYKGTRVTGTVRALAIEDQALMATIALDNPIVIPATDGHRQIDLYTQHVPAHELAPFDDRDELIAEMLAALQAIVALDDGDTSDLWHFDVEFAAGRAAIAKATGASS